MSANKNFRSVSLPEFLVRRIESILKERPDLGYTSVSEFIRDACRDKIEEVVGNVGH